MAVRDGWQDHDVRQFNIFNLESIPVTHTKSLNYNRREYYKASLMSGHARFHYADQSFEINGHALIFTNPMLPYKYEPLGKVQTGFFCIFTPAFFGQHEHLEQYPLYQSANNAIIRLNDQEFDYYNALFNRIYNEIKSDYNFKFDYIRALLAEIIHDAQKKQPALGAANKDSNSYERITLLFNELLERQFPLDMGNEKMKFNIPSHFASQLNIHVNHLNKVLNKTVGQSTTQIIKKRIIQEAKILLKTTNLPISEIGWRLCFEESNHFSTFFKNQEGLTPKQYRQSDSD